MSTELDLLPDGQTFIEIAPQLDRASPQVRELAIHGQTLTVSERLELTDAFLQLRERPLEVQMRHASSVSGQRGIM